MSLPQAGLGAACDRAREAPAARVGDARSHRELLADGYARRRTLQILSRDTKVGHGTRGRVHGGRAAVVMRVLVAGWPERLDARGHHLPICEAEECLNGFLPRRAAREGHETAL